MKSVIEVQNVSRSFSSVKKEEGLKGALGLLLKPQTQTHDALKDVSFELEPGSFNGLIGANGAGKTTALSILLGLLPAFLVKRLSRFFIFFSSTSVTGCSRGSKTTSFAFLGSSYYRGCRPGRA